MEIIESTSQVGLGFLPILEAMKLGASAGVEESVALIRNRKEYAGKLVERGVAKPSV